MPPGAGSHYYTDTLFLSPAWCVIPCCCLWDQWLTVLIQQLYCQLWPLPNLDLSNPWDPWYYFLIHRTKLYKSLDNKRFHGVAEPPDMFDLTTVFILIRKLSLTGWDQCATSPTGPGNVCFQFGDTCSNSSCWIKLLLPQKVRGSGLVRPSKYRTWCYSS